MNDKKKVCLAYVAILVVGAVLLQYSLVNIFEFEKLEFTAKDISYVELFSEGLDISTEIHDKADIDKLIQSINNSEKVAFDIKLCGSSVPPYGIRFYFYDENTEEFLFVPKTYNHELRIATMNRNRSFFKGDLYYVFWDLIAENNLDSDIQNLYQSSIN